MAYDKIIVIHSRLDRCLDYVQNDGKTDLRNAVDYICDPVKAGFQTAINCTLDKSFLQMQETKRRWDKYGGILGYHIPMPALYDPNQMKMAVNPKYNDAEAFAGIATEIAHVRFHAKGYNQNYSRDDYELDAQSVGYMICRRFGVPCEAPDVSNLAVFYDGFDPQDRRQALGQIQDMAQKIGGSIERAITPQVRSRNMNRSAR